MNDTMTYLLSSFQDNPSSLFQGYCFINEDFIFGQEGASKYYEKTGNEVSFGEDGCYVIAKKINNGYLIGSDHSGYKKILYFWDESTGDWAVSNSLNILISHLADNSVKVTPNISLLEMISEGTSVSRQPITFSTIANEIKILPINTFLRIGESVLEISKIDTIEASDTNYSEMLNKFASIWTSRFLTLLSSKDIQIKQGLTGGLDSRAVFSLSNYAYQKSNKRDIADYQLISGPTRGNYADVRIAEEIANHYGYVLNNKIATLYRPNKLTTRERYLSWKNICLGLYHPIYFPSNEINFRDVSIGGHGGENHRMFYAKKTEINTYNDFIKNLCKVVKESELKVDLAIDLYKTLNLMQEVDIHGRDIDPLILHYRHFRSRFHSGLFPQYRVSFTPLSSKFLNNIPMNEMLDKMKTSQVLYDLINITDGLLYFSYDKPNKKPSISNLEQLTSVNTSLDIKLGTIYANVEIAKKKDYSQDDRDILDYLREDFNKACKCSLVRQIWSNTLINDVSKNLNKAMKNKKLVHSSDGVMISAIIATSMFDS